MYIQLKGENCMITAKVFQSGNSQAIRIPSEYHTEQKEFFVRRLGEGFYLIPTNDPWYLVRMGLGRLADESELERDQPLLSDLPESEAL